MTSELCTLIIERKPEVDALDLARDEAVGDIARAGAAEFLRQRHPEQARFAHQPEELRVRLFLEIGLLDAGRELLAAKSRAVSRIIRSSSVSWPSMSSGSSHWKGPRSGP